MADPLYIKEEQNDNVAELPVKALENTATAAGMRFPLHWHERVELLLITSGRLTVRCGAATVVAVPGEVVVVNAKEGHAGRAEEDGTNYRTVMMELAPFLHDPYCGARYIRPLLARQYSFVNLVRDPEVSRATDALADACLYPDATAPLTVESRMLGLLALLLQRHLRTAPPEAAGSGGFRPVLDYLDEHYAAPLTVPALAERFGYDPAYFCRKFRRETGMTCGEYLRTLRLEAAALLLRSERELPVLQLAARCGFEDSNYFSRCFCARYGAPPSRWRKNEMENEKQSNPEQKREKTSD